MALASITSVTMLGLAFLFLVIFFLYLNKSKLISHEIRRCSQRCFAYSTMLVTSCKTIGSLGIGSIAGGNAGIFILYNYFQITKLWISLRKVN